MNHRFGYVIVWTLAVAVLGSGCDAFKSTESRLKHARADVEARNYPAANVELKSLLQRHPENADARATLALVLLRLGDLAGASVELEKAAKMGAAASQIEPLRWEIALAQGKADETLKALSDPRPGLNENTRERFIAEALIRLGRAPEAVTRLSARNDLDSEGRLVLAQALASSGQVPAAITALEALQADPAVGARSSLVRAEYLLSGGRIDEARGALTEAAKLAGATNDRTTQVNAEARLADVELSLGHTDAAKEGLKRAEKIAPNAVIVRLLTGRIALVEKRFGDAIDAFSQVLRVAPGMRGARLLLAQALLQQGSLGQAETVLSDGLAQNLDDTGIRRALVEVQLRQGRPEAAERTLARLDPDQSNDPATILLAARIAIVKGDRASALRFLDRAARLPVAAQSVGLQLASLYLQIGLPNRALEVVGNPAAGAAPKAREVLVRAFALHSSQRADDARREVEAYATAHATEAAAQDVAGGFFAATQQPDLARQYLAAALKIAPNDVTALAQLAQIEAATGNLEQAEALLKRWVAAEPKSAIPRIGLAQIASAKGDGTLARRWLEEARTQDKQAIEPRLLLARGYAVDGNFDSARAVVSEAIAINPKQPTALAAAAFVEERAGDPAKSIEYLRKATAVAPTAYEMWGALGNALLRHNDAAPAADAFDKALAIRPLWQPALEGLLAARERMGDTAGASRLIDGLKAKEGSRVLGLQLEGELEFARGHFRESAAAFTKAIALKPSAELVVSRYRSQAAGHLPEAQRDLEAWLKVRPGDDQVRAVYAEFLQAKGDVAGAIREYEALARKNPMEPVVKNNLAWAYFVAGDHRAVETARAANKLAPRTPEIADTLGWILVNADAAVEGLRYLKEASNGSPKNPEIAYHYAEALNRTGDRKEAKRILDGALATKAQFPSRDAALRLRGQLGPAGS